MGRTEKPVDHSRPARGRLAEHLRRWRESAGMTYETLASRTSLSPATLKRAACGNTVPKRATVEAYIAGCGGDQDAVGAADELWRRARVEERGRLGQLHAPRPDLIGDERDLSRALEVVFEQAGAPSLRDIRDRSGNPLALPVSSAARIVNRDTIPADQQQLQAFLAGCGVPPERHTPWLAAFAKISSQSAGLTGAMPAVDVPGSDAERRVALRQRRQRVTDLAAFWSAMQGDAFPPLLTGNSADLLAGYVLAEAVRNGFTADQVRPWQPDYLVQHDGRYLIFEVKNASGPKRGPQAGGAVTALRRPPGGPHPATARRQPGRAYPAPLPPVTGTTPARSITPAGSPDPHHPPAGQLPVPDRSTTAPDDWFSALRLCEQAASAAPGAA
ncbi:helix-turn-helix domain-containing protein [Streptomyces sp. NPDC001601]|uniref:helix-turn-helix domain-containing protein n=1 Tax=Streptomyces sp. NPDC001601 TaxID=3364592 RepID=UPI00368C9ABD